MRNFCRAVAACLALAAVGSLAGCKDESKGAAQAGVPATTADTAELAKSNAYITAANVGGRTFADALDTYQQTIAPKLAKQKALSDYAVVPPLKVSQIQTRLQTAIALKGSIPELDQVARDFAAAIDAFVPVNNGLANYAESKGFLTDGGAKAREGDAAYVASLSRVAEAETKFLDQIEARDERLVREAYEAAPEGSVERYRAGIILSGKKAMNEVVTVFAEPSNTAARQQFASHLDDMAGMVEKWDAAVRAKKPEGCAILQSSFNSVIAGGRKAVQNAEQGRFNRDAGAPPVGLQFEFSILQSNFASMINELNRPFSC
ncbi:DUF3829 domain-containing protein [Aureimonas sp. D3]|uniref:DUF3829 domain-containing protein n=1 Tax=Aureimonas sp. D3 TaxID=1638164 RepID=UPI0009EB1ED2|nr:DUF3829 domain-containing protein [Aureimonas sp. D3]